MGAMASQIPASRLFSQLFIQAQIKENIKAPRHWLLCGEFTGDLWPVNSSHKWPITRKMFPFDGIIMTQYLACILWFDLDIYLNQWSIKFKFLPAENICNHECLEFHQHFLLKIVMIGGTRMSL